MVVFNNQLESFLKIWQLVGPHCPTQLLHVLFRTSGMLSHPLYNFGLF